MSDTSVVVTSIRTVVALVVVIGLLVLTTRLLRRLNGVSIEGAQLRVVARQALGRGASIAVVRTATQQLVVGVGESGVTLLTTESLPTPSEIAVSERASSPVSLLARRVVAPRATPRSTATTRPAPSTPAEDARSFLDTLRDRTVRRG